MFTTGSILEVARSWYLSSYYSATPRLISLLWLILCPRMSEAFFVAIKWPPVLFSACPVRVAIFAIACP